MWRLGSSYTYKALECTKISSCGLRLDVGVTQYYYNTPTAAWLGNHGGPCLSLSIPIVKWNLGVRFKPYTVNPRGDLVFNKDTLTRKAKLNPVKTDFFVSYSFDFKYNFSCEPYLGYSINSFHVINQDSLKKLFVIPSTVGIIGGLTLNKYFRLSPETFMAVFASMGYAFADFKKAHPTLEAGYTEWTAGIAFKGFFKRRLYKKIG